MSGTHLHGTACASVAGEPLVLLHPLGGELVVWEPVLAGASPPTAT